MVKYSVIEDRRKVVARLEGCENDAYNLLMKRLPAGLILDKNAVKMQNVFKASVTCHPEDDFDEDIGKAIAKVRVIEKYNRAMFKILDSFADSIGTYLDDIVDRVDYFED